MMMVEMLSVFGKTSWKDLCEKYGKREASKKDIKRCTGKRGRRDRDETINRLSALTEIQDINSTPPVPRGPASGAGPLNHQVQKGQLGHQEEFSVELNVE